MKESTFVALNAAKWKSFEAIINNRKLASADELADNYIRVTDDLAYSATFYPDSPTTRYLNQLSRSFHVGIYRGKREKFSRFFKFFSREVPLAVLKNHPQLLSSFIFFTLAIAVGVVSSMYDENFIRFIMGDEYVNMTLQNIDKGDPMAVYKGTSSFGMFYGIAVNNIYVSFFAFVYGIFLSAGTVYFLIQNGLMVGAFLTMFGQKGLIKVALLSIFLHGALELSALVIAGGAGLVIGNSILFPGTYNRMESLQLAARRGLKMSVGLVPIFITAAIFESYVTRRYQQMPVGLSLAVIIGSFAFIGWYFIWLPLRLKTVYEWKR